MLKYILFPNLLILIFAHEYLSTLHVYIARDEMENYSEEHPFEMTCVDIHGTCDVL